MQCHPRETPASCCPVRVNKGRASPSAERSSMPQGAVLSQSSYVERVNPQWVRLLELLQMNVRYQRCIGAELFSETGDRYLDFLSGYCVHNTGHNHPQIIAALQE